MCVCVYVRVRRVMARSMHSVSSSHDRSTRWTRLERYARRGRYMCILSLPEDVLDIVLSLLDCKDGVALCEALSWDSMSAPKTVAPYVRFHCATNKIEASLRSQISHDAAYMCSLHQDEMCAVADWSPFSNRHTRVLARYSWRNFHRGRNTFCTDVDHVSVLEHLRDMRRRKCVSSRISLHRIIKFSTFTMILCEEGAPTLVNVFDYRLSNEWG